jgi:hypothetical protein
MKRKMERVRFELLVLYNSLSFGRGITAIGKAGCGRGFKSSHPVHFSLLENYGIILNLI